MLARLWAWAKKDPVPALTLGGLVVYAILRLPYGVYYGTLGTSPEDVGLSYVETLARSTAGLVVAALLVGVVAFAAAGLITTLVFYGRGLWASVSVRGRLNKKRFAEMTDEEYAADRARIRRLLTTVFRSTTAEVDALLADSDEVRGLAILGVRTQEQQAKVNDHRARKPLRLMVSLVSAEARKVGRRWGRLGATGASLAILVGLPLVAYVDALGVRECRAPALGQVGMFAVRGATSEVYRVDDKGAATRMLGDRTTMYLGNAEDRLVLFDCTNGRVLRLPAESVLVAST